MKSAWIRHPPLTGECPSRSGLDQNPHVLTERLELRLPAEADRQRFVELFADDAFMVFTGGVLDRNSANVRFDRMIATAREFPFAKQPVIERSSRDIIGYSGVDRFEFNGDERLEFGYRLVPAARGRGYATEAGQALLAVAAETFEGEILAMIDPGNRPSQNVARKLGFQFSKQGLVNGHLNNLYYLRIDRR
jgi:RimJ/RimL family protein N-acetyltransferase